MKNSNEATSKRIYDVAIVGGGPAGLSAALWLARYCHSVVLVDSGDPRNWETRGIHGFLGAHAIRSPELRGRGREQAEKFGAKLIDAEVTTAERIAAEHFRLHLKSRVTIDAKRILLAIGIRDMWPTIPGLDECYGDTVHVCPDCDGYETRDKKTVVVGVGKKAVGMAFALTTWTDEIVICTNGEAANIRKEKMNKLQALNIPVLTESIVCIRHDQGEIRCVELEGGKLLDCERLYFAIGQYPADDIGAQLRCDRDENGLIVVNDSNHTSVRNVFAAGDIVPGPQLAITAAAGGAVAALAIHHSLVPAERQPD
ncbi:MAG TPA: NAD(P)/FAD-dependent oxidoreductase [Gemmatimonadaceae bacterium]